MKTEKDIVYESLLSRIRELEHQVATRDMAISKVSWFPQYLTENPDSVKCYKNHVQLYLYEMFDRHLDDDVAEAKLDADEVTRLATAFFKDCDFADDEYLRDRIKEIHGTGADDDK